VVPNHLNQLQYHKYCGSKPFKSITISILIFNPHNITSQQFFKKNIFKESYWKAKNEPPFKLIKTTLTNIYFKYAGLDEYPFANLEKQCLKYKKLIKIYLKYSNGSEPCNKKSSQFECIKFTYEEKKEFSSSNLSSNYKYQTPILATFSQTPQRFLWDSTLKLLPQYPQSGDEKFLDYLKKLLNKIQ
jgi:hypothetical protein